MWNQKLTLNFVHCEGPLQWLITCQNSHVIFFLLSFICTIIIMQFYYTRPLSTAIWVLYYLACISNLRGTETVFNSNVTLCLLGIGIDGITRLCFTRTSLWIWVQFLASAWVLTKKDTSFFPFLKDKYIGYHGLLDQGFKTEINVWSSLKR